MLAAEIRVNGRQQAPKLKLLLAPEQGPKLEPGRSGVASMLITLQVLSVQNNTLPYKT